MKRPLALLVLVATAAVASGCSSTLSDAATVRFTLKGSTHSLHVRRDDLLAEVSKLVADKPFATWFKKNNFPLHKDVSADSKIAAVWLSQLIHQQAIDALFASRHLRVTKKARSTAAKDVVSIFPPTTPKIFPAFPAEFRSLLTDRQARTEVLLASFTTVTDAQGEKYFRAHQAQFSCASGKNVSHILVATQAAAQQIVDQLKSGSQFGALAQKDSTDQASAVQGGLLGCLAASQFVAEFQTAADAAPFDKVVGPVKSQFGYHVILVTHATSSYDSYKAQVRKALSDQGQTDAQTAIDGLLKGFKVHVDPRFGTWGHTASNGGPAVYQVSPPKEPKPSTQRGGTTTTVPTAPTTAVPGAAPGSP